MLLWFDNNITNNSKGGYSNEKYVLKSLLVTTTASMILIYR